MGKGIKKGKKEAYTLMELVIVIAIIMIMASLGVWKMRERAVRNELLRLKAQVPAFLETSTLRVYQRGIETASLSINTDSLEINNVTGYQTELEPRYFTFSSSVTSVAINKFGTFDTNTPFVISVMDGATTRLAFTIRSSRNLGIYSVSTSSF